MGVAQWKFFKMAANTGYHSAPQPRLTVAPPLGHIPPPPPTNPPPYSYFSPQPSNHTHPVTAYGQYAPEPYDSRQSIATMPQVDSTIEESSSIIQTIGQVSKTINDTMDSNELKEHKQSHTHDNSRGSEEETEGEGKYRSDEALKMKFSGGFTAKKRPNPAIAVQLKPQATFTKKPKVDAGKASVAQAFGSDSEDEVEEMPKAAKLRMRNIGKDTPTSAGPNSFNKTTKGFTDTAAAFKKQFDL